MAIDQYVDSGEAKRSAPAYSIDPLVDERWPALVQYHARASVFHSRQWLEALFRTYGYRPVVYTTSPFGGPITNGLVVCVVKSWLTGPRLVSMPFSDHCEPLVDTEDDPSQVDSLIRSALTLSSVRYLEVRPLAMDLEVAALPRSTYTACLHRIDLSPNLDDLYQCCHESTRRNIARAKKNGLRYEEGRSGALLDTFLALHTLTRRRHRAPPQPKNWFLNLIDAFGDNLKIRVAYRASRPLAAILTLRCNHTMTYKYGCSDLEVSNSGATHFLLWKTVEEAKMDGLRVLDLGRSDFTNAGLLTFKDRLGGRRSTLMYSRFVIPGNKPASWSLDESWGRGLKTIIAKLPDRLFCGIGSVMYKHLG